MYGLYDTQDDCWIGDDNGARTIDDHMLARAMAQIVECQMLGTDLGGRIVAREIPEGPWTIKDEIPLKKSTLKAIQTIECKVDTQ